MTQFDKPILRPSGDDLERARAVLTAHLMAATEVACDDMQCTGVSFVTSAIGLWATELHELDPVAASHFFGALTDITDPKATDKRREKAEQRRRKAVERLFRAANLAAAEPEGSA